MGPKRINGEKSNSNADERQTKISSFFQNGPSKDVKTSNLFTTINQKSCSVPPPKKRAKLSLASRKNLGICKEIGNGREDTSDVIIVDVPDGPLTEKENLLNNENDIEVISVTMKDENTTEREKEKSQDFLNASFHNSESKIGSIQQKNLKTKRDNINKHDMSNIEECSRTSALETGHTGKSIVLGGNCETASENPCDSLPMLCSTPVKFHPKMMETFEVDSPDIIFDTPFDSNKKRKLFNHNLTSVPDHSVTSLKGSSDNSPMAGKSFQPTLSNEGKTQIKAGLSSEGIIHETDPKLRHGQSSAMPSINEISALAENLAESAQSIMDNKRSKVEILHGCSSQSTQGKNISTETLSEVCYPSLCHESEEHESLEPFQHTLIKHGGGQNFKQICRTSSDSKLLNALRESEVNAQEREIQQELKEKVMWGTNPLNISQPKSCSHSSLSIKYDKKAQMEFDGFESYEDLIVIEDTVTNKRQSSSKEVSLNHVDSDISLKKARKVIPKYIEDCNRHRQIEVQDVTLKDDSVLTELMNKLSSSARHNDNSGDKCHNLPNPHACLSKTKKLNMASGKLSYNKNDNGNIRNVSGKTSSTIPMSIKLLVQDGDICTDPTLLSFNSKVTLQDPTQQEDDCDDILVLSDSPEVELIDCPSTNDSVLKIVQEEGFKRKQTASSDSMRVFSPPGKRFATIDKSIIVVEEDDTFESSKSPITQGCDFQISVPTMPTESGLSEPVAMSTKRSPVIPEEVSQPKALKEITSVILDDEQIEESQYPTKSSSSFSHKQLLSLPISQQHVFNNNNPDIKSSVSIDAESEYQKVSNSQGYLDSSLNSLPDHIPNKFATENACPRDGTNMHANVEDSFDFHDDSLLLAAAGNGSPEFPTASSSKCMGVHDDDQSLASDFCFAHSWQRFIVKTVSEDQNRGEKYLGLLKENQSLTTHRCVLRDFWADTRVREGDVVNVIATFDNRECIITDTSGFLIVNPDVLMSGTAVVSSVFCMRKSVLNEMVKSHDIGNTHMLYGRFLHSLFQAILKDSVVQRDEINAIAKTILSSSKFLHEMYTNCISESKLWEEINEYIPALISWVSQHTKIGSASAKRKATDNLIVTDVQDIEENIWSPKLGLKGKIDLTVKVNSMGSNRERILPLEVKTGKASFSAEHKGQVILYSMMYGDRREEPGEGILLYLKHSEMEVVKVKPQSQSGLIQLRNSMASFLHHLIEQTQSEDGESTFSLRPLPEPINSQRGCVKCPHLLTCCMYQKSVEKLSHSNHHAMNQLSTETLSHLEELDLDYFQHWVLCLSLENQKSSKKKLKEIWTLSSEEREKRGDCLRRLVIVSSELGIQETQGFTEGQGCSLTFIRHHSYEGPKMDVIGLSAHDSVVVSSEDGRLIALSNGFIRNISSDHVEVVVDRDNLSDTASYSDILFRLDRNNSISTHGTLMGNVSRLMEQAPHAAKMRSLIIKKTPPSFEMKIPMPWVKKIKPIFKDMNKPQKSAILKVLMSNDYILIRGFPGTGKTSTIVGLVKVLNALGKSVLLTSYTHSAVDTICLKLKQDDVHFLRLGRQSRIHREIISHSAEILTTKLKSVQSLTDFYASYNIVATSCLGMTHSLFTRRRFDVCIVDEASQILQPACLGPLFNCDKFVLVGDAQQLPPLVQSKEARTMGMDESLFTRLEDCGATYDLNLQYRMNETIMELSNTLVYDGKLKCGSPEVAQQCLSINKSLLKDCPLWIHQALNCDIKKSVSFIDTGKTSCSDVQDNKGSCNETEANIVIDILESLVKINVNCADIGVISPYRSQVKFLQQKKESLPALTGIEINTIDQYQGRDKSVIIVSFVYSSFNSGGELLKDIRRLNVALTRAKSKLILIGNAQALHSLDHLHSLLTHLERSDNIIHQADF